MLTTNAPRLDAAMMAIFLKSRKGEKSTREEEKRKESRNVEEDQKINDCQVT